MGVSGGVAPMPKPNASITALQTRAAGITAGRPCGDGEKRAATDVDSPTTQSCRLTRFVISLPQGLPLDGGKGAGDGQQANATISAASLKTFSPPHPCRLLPLLQGLPLNSDRGKAAGGGQQAREPAPVVVEEVWEGANDPWPEMRQQEAVQPEAEQQ